MIGMNSVGVIGRYKEAGGNAHEVIIFCSAHCPVYAVEGIPEECACRPLLCDGTDLFIVKYTVDCHGIPGFCFQKAL